MPPTEDAVLPSPDSDSSAVYDDRGSSRSLDEVGAVAVLGAMVEQRKRASSIPAPSEVDETDAVATQRRPRIDPSDDVFQKIR